MYLCFVNMPQKKYLNINSFLYAVSLISRYIDIDLITTAKSAKLKDLFDFPSEYYKSEYEYSYLIL